MSPPAGRRATTHELAILNHPDRRATWVGIMVATLAKPDPGLASAVAERLPTLTAVVPPMRARWSGHRWREGEGPRLIMDPTLSSLDARLTRPFDLAAEAPLRVAADPDGAWLALIAHHSAFDGLTVVAILRALLGGGFAIPAMTAPAPARSRPALREPVRRLFAPADPVAASAVRPDEDTLALRVLAPHGAFTGTICQACVSAVAAHNLRRGRPFRRVGLSVARGGGPGIGNLSSYVRLNLTPEVRVSRAVHLAITHAPPPAEQVFAPRALRLLAPVAARFSSSLLVSNLGELDLPGVEHVAVYPDIHGRTAVGFAAVETRDGQATLALRARELDRADAERILDDVLDRISQTPSPTPPAARLEPR